MADTVAGLLPWLEDSAVATAIRQSSWLYPFFEIIHIVGIVLLVGAAFLFDLRLLGLSRNLPVKALARHLLPWSQRGLYLIIPSGLLLFSTNAVALAADPMFQLKLILLALGGANAGVFHRYIYRSSATWSTKQPPRAAKAAAVCSIMVWLAVIACGRLLAY